MHRKVAICRAQRFGKKCMNVLRAHRKLLVLILVQKELVIPLNLILVVCIPLKAIEMMDPRNILNSIELNQEAQNQKQINLLVKEFLIMNQRIVVPASYPQHRAKSNKTFHFLPKVDSYRI